MDNDYANNLQNPVQKNRVTYIPAPTYGVIGILENRYSNILKVNSKQNIKNDPSYFTIVQNSRFFFSAFCLSNIIKMAEINNPYFKIKLLNKVKQNLVNVLY